MMVCVLIYYPDVKYQQRPSGIGGKDELCFKSDSLYESGPTVRAEKMTVVMHAAMSPGNNRLSVVVSEGILEDVKPVFDSQHIDGSQQEKKSGLLYGREATDGMAEPLLGLKLSIFRECCLEV